MKKPPDCRRLVALAAVVLTPMSLAAACAEVPGPTPNYFDGPNEVDAGCPNIGELEELSVLPGISGACVECVMNAGERVEPSGELVVPNDCLPFFACI
jgi:hypothetical protein